MAVVGEDEPASETPRAARVRAVLRIEEPIIRAERPVKPQGMIEAGDLEAGIEDGMAMRAERDVEQSHVRKISEHGAMNGGIARERPRRAQPDILFEGACFVLDITAKIDGTDFDGAVLGKPAANRVRHRGTKATQDFGFAWQVFRQRNLGHCDSMFEPRFLDLERCRE